MVINEEKLRKFQHFNMPYGCCNMEDYRYFIHELLKKTGGKLEIKAEEYSPNIIYQYSLKTNYDNDNKIFTIELVKS